MSELSGLSTADKEELLKNLQEALYSGLSRVKFRERDVTFQSAAEMRKTIADIEASLGVSKVTKQGVIFASFGKGL